VSLLLDIYVVGFVLAIGMAFCCYSVTLFRQSSYIRNGAGVSRFQSDYEFGLSYLVYVRSGTVYV
jgi:hypothetical protein